VTGQMAQCVEHTSLKLV